MANSLRPFTFNANDLQFLLAQIRFRPLFDVAGNPIIAWSGVGAIYDQVGNQLWDGNTATGPFTSAAAAIAIFGTSYNAATDISGLRQVTGNGNNLVNGQLTWGAVDQAFIRSANADFTHYLQPYFAGATQTGPAVANVTDPTVPMFIGQQYAETIVSANAQVFGALQIDKTTKSTAQTTVDTTTTTTTDIADGHHWHVSLTSTTTAIKTDTTVLDVFGDPVAATNKYALLPTTSGYIDAAHASVASTTTDKILTGGELDTSAFSGTFRGVSANPYDPTQSPANFHPGLQAEIAKITVGGANLAALADYSFTVAIDPATQKVVSTTMHDVVDYTPRMISQTITGNGSKVVYDSKGHYVSGDGVVLLHDAQNHIVYYTPGMTLTPYQFDASKVIDTSHLVVGAAIVDTSVPLLAGQAEGSKDPSIVTGDSNLYSGAGYGQLSIQGQIDKQNTDANNATGKGDQEYFYGNIASIAGNAPNNGFFALFGQFFDHGLDFIAKNSGYQIVIPLAVDDPLYGAIGPDGQPQTTITINRATVSGVDAAGNPQYIDHSSPYIDQSQTYGSVDDVTQILRQWVKDPVTGNYIAGATLFDGNHTKTYTDANGNATNATLPTLNELRVHVELTRGVSLDANGMDVLDANGVDQGLTWEDVSQALRHRDASGHVVSGANGQPISSTEPLLLDMNPKFDSAHLSTAAATNAMKVLGLTFDANGQISLAQLAKWVDFSNFSIQTTEYGAPVGTPLGPNETARALTPDEHRAIGEILLDSVGDHYIAGDGRANENFGLTAIHQVWHEEHSYQVHNIEATVAKLDQAQVALGDISHKTLHDWQVGVHGTPGAAGVTVGADGYLVDTLGNYVDSFGTISWNQDTLFKAAKLTVEMEYQHVAVDQYARAVSPDIQEFAGYSSGKNADISLEFSQAAFRFGHSTLRETIDTMDPNGTITGKITSYALEAAFLNPQGFAAVGAGAIVQGQTRQLMNEVDEFITPSLQQGLLGQPLDLGAINIARGRDVGLPTLNAFRTSAGMSAYTSWNDFGIHIVHASSLVNFIAAYAFDGDNAHAQAILDAANGLATADTIRFGITQLSATKFLNSSDTATGGNDSFNRIDLWIGGIAEKHVAGGILGETFNAIFVNQIESLMDGDRFYYLQRLINQDFGNEIQNEQFVDIVERNTGTKNLNGNIFTYADQYYDFGQSGNAPTSHIYGDQVASYALAHNGNGIGIYSDGGVTTALNGTVLHENFTIALSDASLSGPTGVVAPSTLASQSGVVSGDYILDARPDGTTHNLDGSLDTGISSAEVIVGTNYNDFIKAGEGDDTVYGQDGNDIIYGGGGADKLYGGNGNDILYGGDAPDILDGGAGDDILFGDSSGSSVNGVDQLIGGSGNDYVYGGIGIDKMFGGTGDDHMYGGTDTDPFMYGGDGNDYMNGDSGQDILFGGNGSDIIDGGTGIDQLYGDAGDDILRPGDGVSDISGNGGGGDVLIGGDNVTDTGFDFADYSQQTAAAGLVGDLANQVVAQAVLDKLTQGQQPTVFNTSTIWFQLEGIIGTPSGDRLFGDSATDASALVSHGDNWLIGGGGNDEITGRGGNDIIIGGSIRLDTLIGTYSGTYNPAEGSDGASHRTTGTLQANGLLDFASGNGVTFTKHFQELLKSEAYKDYVLGDGGKSGGTDQADYTGKFADYKLELVRFQSANEGLINAVKVTDTVTGRDGTDLLVGIEKFSFADGIQTFTQLFTVVPVVTLALVQDTGVSSTDLITSNPSIKGVGQPFASVFAVIDNGSLIQIATASATGAWNYTPALIDGVHTIVVSETNLAGTGSASLTFTLDSKAPPVTAALVTDTGASSTDHYTSASAITGTGDPNAVVFAVIDGGAAIQIATGDNTTGAWSYSPTFGDGTHTIAVSETDLAGNIGKTSIALTLDSKAPPVTAALAADTGASKTDGITNNPKITGSGDRNAVVFASINGGAAVQVTTADATTGAWTYTTSADGSFGIVFSETDLAGNTGTASVNYVLDTKAPAIPVLTGLTYSATAAALTSYTLSGTAEAGSTVVLSNGGAAPLGTVTAAADGKWTFTITPAPGTNISSTLTLTATDLAGNTSVGQTAGLLVGASGPQTLTALGAFPNWLVGLAGNDTLNGGDGNDTLDGGLGFDRMTGGKGDDTYVVDNVGDVVVENQNEGTDTILTSLTTFSLTASGANVENLTYTGGGNFTGTGNTLANVITGGAGKDTLSDGGGTGIDTLIGGAGDDIYNVSVAGDVITEQAGGGIDTVRTTLGSYTLGDTLGANLENLTFTGSNASFIGTGNGLTNVITGGGGADTLDGGVNDLPSAGDTLVGGRGDDTYLIRNLNDVINEGFNSGNDTANVYVNTYTLGANVENMTFLGSGDFTGTGNTGNNVLTGGAGNDTLNGGRGNDRLVGGAGADTLTGGTGADVFVLAKGDAMGDLITDFSRNQGDQIQLSLYDTNPLLTMTLVKTGTATAANPTTTYAVQVGGATVDTFKLTGDITLVNNQRGADYRFV